MVSYLLNFGGWVHQEGFHFCRKLGRLPLFVPQGSYHAAVALNVLEEIRWPLEMCVCVTVVWLEVLASGEAWKWLEFC